MPVTFGHINIRTSRLDETIAFYRALFDFTVGEAATMADQTGNAWLFDSEGWPVIHLNALRDGDDFDPARRSALDHVAFNCPDLPDMRRRLAAIGADYREAQSRVPGMTQINVHDPNGVKVELTFGADTVRRLPD